MNDWLNKTRKIEKELLEVFDELTYLSRAFYQTGNETMAAKLNELAYRVDEANSNLSKMTSGKIDEDYKKTVQASANILETALRVAEKSKNS